MSVLAESVIHSLFRRLPVPSNTLEALFIYERNVRTVPLIVPLQMGHFLKEGAHSWQTTRWPQGMNTIETSLSMHTLQVRSSCNLRNCSSNDKPKTRKECEWNAVSRKERDNGRVLTALYLRHLLLGYTSYSFPLKKDSIQKPLL